jgi:hypothetical protein
VTGGPASEVNVGALAQVPTFSAKGNEG